MSKKVLFIANDFPPVGGGGVQRSVYFVKYLMSFGWKPHVLTVKDIVFPSKDASLLEEIPSDVPVHRTGSLELRRLLWIAQRAREALPSRKPETPSRSSIEPTSSDGETPLTLRTWFRELGRTLRKWLFVPDDRALWAPFAIPRALRVIRAAGIDAVYATTPGYSTGTIGDIVSRLSGLPFVLDLRDPWCQDPYLPSATPLHGWLNRRLERSAVTRASTVLLVSEALRSAFVRAYPDQPADKFRVVTNGFDAAPFEATAARRDPDGFSLLYVGSLFAHHVASFQAFCRAWCAVAARNPTFRQQAKMRVVGRCDPEIVDAAERSGVPIEILGYLPHGEAIGHLKGADALLLLIKDLDPDHDVISIPGKLFEYVGARRPILMIGPDGDAADIVRETGGEVHRESASADIEQGLETLFARAGSPPATAGTEPAARYDRRSLTGDLARVLDATVAGDASASLSPNPHPSEA